MRAIVSRYICRLRGGSQPILAQASDGLLYVLKFANNLQGPNLPFNESIGSHLYRACGLPVSSWKALVITDSFLDNNPACWIHTEAGVLRPAFGVCFGTLFLGGIDIRLVEILSKNRFHRVSNQADFWLAWLIDICAAHADHRQAIFVENANGRFDATFVDHGHMFGGPRADLEPHFKASRYLDSRIYHGVSSSAFVKFQRILLAMDTDKLWRSVKSLPDEWKTQSALDSFRQCLDNISTRILLRNIVDTMIDSYERTAEFEKGNRQRRRKSQLSIRRPGVQGEGPEQICVVDSDCA
jgi:hypothetical protein